MCVKYKSFRICCLFFFFFSSRRRHTRYWRDWSSDVCSSDLEKCTGTFFWGSPRTPWVCRLCGVEVSRWVALRRSNSDFYRAWRQRSLRRRIHVIAGVKTSQRFGRQRLNEIPEPCIYRTEQTAARILLRRPFKDDGASL